jgi:predicted CoA-binding protein
MSDFSRMLAETRTIAVLGAHGDPARPAHYVPAYMHERGYRVVGVNPRLAGTELFGSPVRANLAEVGEPIDMVNVFRRSEDIDGHEAEILALEPRPKVVWFQLGIRNDRVAAALEAAGIEVVQDRCLLVEHRRVAAAGA